MTEQPPANPEEMARLLRTNIQKRRRRVLPTILIALLLCAVPVALLAWRSLPGPELPRLALIAFDQVALPAEEVDLRAQLTPQAAGVPPPDLGGLGAAFEELKSRLQPDEPARLIQARSNQQGVVTVPWQAPAGEEMVEFRAAYADPRQRFRTEDRARLFTWKADTQILLVEVAALATVGADTWRTGHIRDIAAREGADKALQAARQKNYQVVYVTAGAGSPMGYRKMRGWVETKSQEERAFPDGPVLGLVPDAEDGQAAAAWAPFFAGVKQRFRGPLVGVAKDPQLAEVLRAAGAMAFVVGEAGDVPPGITRLASWPDLAAKLPQ